MADLYMNLSYNEWKVMEAQMKAFKETEHGKGTEYYHKSLRITLGEITIEFHGPVVKARQLELHVEEKVSSFSSSSSENDRRAEDALDERQARTGAEEYERGLEEKKHEKL